jgi:hypothetical protein
MDTTSGLILIIALAVVIGIVVWIMSQRRRTENLRKQFGPEYDRAVTEHGDQRRAEAELAARQARVEQLHIRQLEPADRERYSATWHSTQARFVDEPAVAIAEADRLVAEVMHARGYPVGDFEQRVADISVDHPDVVSNYRAARTIALANERGEANTEDLRKAMVYYRALFEDLLDMKEREVAR